MEVQGEWIPTPSLIRPDAEKTLESFDGLWASPGSPYKSFDTIDPGLAAHIVMEAALAMAKVDPARVRHAYLA